MLCLVLNFIEKKKKGWGGKGIGALRGGREDSFDGVIWESLA